MAMIKCVECGNDISDKATTCPHCGAPVSLSVNQVEEETECTLSVQRIRAAAYSVRSVKLYIDGDQIDSLDNGQSGEYEVCVGNHTIELFLGHRSIGTTQIYIDGSTNVQVKFMISNVGTAVFETTGITKSGKNPTYAIPTSNTSITEVKKKQSREAVNAMLGIIALVIVFLLIWTFFESLSGITIRFTLSPG